MSDTKAFDQAVKTATKLIDDWGKEIEKIAAALDKVKTDQDAKDKKPGPTKEQEKAAKDAEDASKELQKQLANLKLPPQADPKQALKLPDILTKHINKNGVKIGDYGSFKPDIDLDLKKMQIKKVGIVWTWEW